MLPHTPLPPSVSVLLMGYRSESTIIEALDGALSQTVPCEIIVSDDASADSTLAIVSDHLRGYAGIHSVSVRRNERNLGVCAHIMALEKIATGDILVFMAGDDVSYPHRVRKILELFARHPEAYAVGSAYDEVDAAGGLLRSCTRMLPETMDQQRFLSHGKFSTLHGATMAIRRDVLTRFPPLQGKVEDNMLSLRAALLGTCANVREPLIAYRIHDNNLTKWVFSASTGDADAAFRRRYRRTIDLYREVADDQERCLAALPGLDARKRRLGQKLVEMYRLESAGREAVLDLPKFRWLGPIWNGLMHPGLRRKSLERALKLLLPRRLIR